MLRKCCINCLGEVEQDLFKLSKQLVTTATYIDRLKGDFPELICNGALSAVIDAQDKLDILAADVRELEGAVPKENSPTDIVQPPEPTEEDRVPLVLEAYRGMLPKLFEQMNVKMPKDLSVDFNCLDTA